MGILRSHGKPGPVGHICNPELLACDGGRNGRLSKALELLTRCNAIEKERRLSQGGRSGVLKVNL